jgi:hypothetical protein
MEISLFEKYQIPVQTKYTPEQQIISDFVSKLKEERGTQTHYTDKQGKKKKLAEITYMSIKMKLYAIREPHELEAFYQDCLKHTDFKSFSQYFYTKCKAKNQNSNDKK